jgi:beta-phosphoglucomutase-like phosphatase (HAD superfamily)
VYVVVEDIDPHCQQAKSAGATLLGEPHGYDDGHRGYSPRARR